MKVIVHFPSLAPKSVNTHRWSYRYYLGRFVCTKCFVKCLKCLKVCLIFQIKAECLSTRYNAALFNMSYFGKFWLHGPDAQVLIYLK